MTKLYASFVTIIESPTTWVFLGFAFLCWLVLQAPRIDPPSLPFWAEINEGLKQSPLMRALFWFAIFLSPFWVFALGLSVWEAYLLLQSYPDRTAKPADLRWHSSLLLGLLAATGGLFTLLFAFIRAFATERQTRSAEQQRVHDELALVNQRIQGALEQLSARYNRTRMGRTVKGQMQWLDEAPETPEGTTCEWHAVQFSEPDTQTRLAGIGQLDAIAKEYPNRRRAINEHLASFIRANAPGDTARPAPEFDGDSADQKRQLRTWISSLSIAADIQAALSLIGASTLESETRALDLRRTNLQRAELIGIAFLGINLAEAHLEGADLGGAHLEGADLREAHLEGASLWQAHLEGADLWRAHLEGANLGEAHLEGANLRLAHLEGANLRLAHLEGANLRLAHLEGADLRWAHLEGADLGEAQFDNATSLSAATLRGAALREVDCTQLTMDQTQCDAAFGDGSVTLPEGLNRPAHWPSETLKFEEFLTRWRAWQAEIGYKSPSD